jgi:hypothetical protein
LMASGRVPTTTRIFCISKPGERLGGADHISVLSLVQVISDFHLEGPFNINRAVVNKL